VAALIVERGQSLSGQLTLNPRSLARSLALELDRKLRPGSGPSARRPTRSIGGRQRGVAIGDLRRRLRRRTRGRCGRMRLWLWRFRRDVRAATSAAASARAARVARAAGKIRVAAITSTGGVGSGVARALLRCSALTSPHILLCAHLTFSDHSAS
jgi:hypothetical protein